MHLKIGINKKVILPKAKSYHHNRSIILRDFIGRGGFGG
jgi:hypothetical protein